MVNVGDDGVQNMMWNNPHVIEQEILNEQKKAMEDLNFPNPFTQLQEEWAEEISAKEAEKEELKEAAKKKHKLSPGALKKLKEYKPL